jgi:hypothetical protein
MKAALSLDDAPAGLPKGLIFLDYGIVPLSPAVRNHERVLYQLRSGQGAAAQCAGIFQPRTVAWGLLF